MSIDGLGEDAYLGPRLGNGTQVVDQVCLGHTDTGIANGENVILLVGDDANVQLLFILESGRIGQRSISNFIERIRAVRDQFTQEDLLVGIESI